MFKKALIAHEAPRAAMDRVQEITDYDYCLVHLLEEDPTYLKFFKEAKDKGRSIIMDCSLFELGHAFDPEKYYKWLLEIQPNEYIIPDVWQECESNLKSYKEFTSKFDLSKLTGKRIGVLQGRSYEDFKRAYLFMKTEADKIAISFGYDYYWENFSTSWQISGLWIGQNLRNVADFEKMVAKPTSYAHGRTHLIESLFEDEIWDTTKPHHLLGCGIPIEFANLDPSIESIDTSHPVMCGFYEKSYEEPTTMWSKIHEKMVDVYDKDISDSQWNLIKSNITQFKNLV